MNQLILGDCLEKMKDIPDKSVDMILTDLPYNIHNMEWDKQLDLKLLWHQFYRIIKYNCGIILFSGGLFTSVLIHSNPKDWKYELIWQKSKCGSPLNAKYMPMRKHENIQVFSKKGKAIKYNPQMETGTPYKRDITDIKLNNLKYGLKYVKTENFGTRYPSSILNFPQKWRRQDQIHTTQKPVELFEYLIKTYTNENDLVLDCCAGSGTTAIACINTNRNYICIEKDESYFNIMKNRVENKK